MALAVDRRERDAPTSYLYPDITNSSHINTIYDSLPAYTPPSYQISEGYQQTYHSTNGPSSLYPTVNDTAEALYTPVRQQSQQVPHRPLYPPTRRPTVSTITTIPVPTAQQFPVRSHSVPTLPVDRSRVLAAPAGSSELSSPSSSSLRAHNHDEIKARERRAKQRIRLLEKMVPLAKDRARLKAELDRKSSCKSRANIESDLVAIDSRLRSYQERINSLAE